MKSARGTTLASEDEPEFVVLAQGPVLKAEPAGTCPRCTRWEDPSCDCHRLKQLCSLFDETMIPALYVNATLPSLELHDESSASLRRTVQAVQQWAQRKPPPEKGLLLSGPNGVGKSFLMAALARSLTLQRGMRCRFVDFGDLLQRLKATFDGQGLEFEILFYGSPSPLVSRWYLSCLSRRRSFHGRPYDVHDFIFKAAVVLGQKTNMGIQARDSFGGFDTDDFPGCSHRLSDRDDDLQTRPMLEALVESQGRAPESPEKKFMENWVPFRP